MVQWILFVVVIAFGLWQGVTQGEYAAMEDGDENSQSIPIDLQSDQQNTSSSQDGQSKRDDVIVIDSDDEDDDDEENEGEQEVCISWNSFMILSFIFHQAALIWSKYFWPSKWSVSMLPELVVF